MSTPSLNKEYSMTLTLPRGDYRDLLNDIFTKKQDRFIQFENGAVAFFEFFPNIHEGQFTPGVPCYVRVINGKEILLENLYKDSSMPLALIQVESRLGSKADWGSFVETSDIPDGVAFAKKFLSLSDFLPMPLDAGPEIN